MSEAAPPAGPDRGSRRLSGPWAAGVVLALFWILLVGSLRDKSLTFDEAACAAAGYADWRFNDYRLQPEIGQLPQRVIGLPLALGDWKFPARDAAAWRDSQFLDLGHEWFYQLGNDAAAMAWRGRTAASLFAVALGALVWAWSRRLFGPPGGMLSLLLYGLSPTVLANGALMTSDMAVSLFFAGAIGALWRLMARMTAGRLALSALMVGGLVISKFSALLIGPVALLLVVARLADGRPLPVGRRELTRRSAQALALAGAAVVHVAVVIVLIWGVYGFRYSAFAEPRLAGSQFALPWEYILGKPDPGPLLAELNLSAAQEQEAGRIFSAQRRGTPLQFNAAVDALAEIRRTVLTPAQQARFDGLRAAPSPTVTGRVAEFLRRHELLPEAWIYGLANILRVSQARCAFFNGDFSTTGWAAFFPYTFLVKTPLAVFGVLALALAAVGAAWRRARAPSLLRWLWSRAYPVLPLWAFLLVYGAVAIGSHLNIGHRHLLPVYAPVFVLGGIAAGWLEAWRARGTGRLAAFTLLGLMGLLAAEVLGRFPNYLAYYNGLVRPSQAYRHLVDSSLDWGQDLPAVRRYIAARPADGPYYFSYFGTADPAYHGITAHPLYSYLGLHTAARPAVRLAGGTYLISASMLQPVYFELEGPWGPWNERHERTYQHLCATLQPLLDGDVAARAAAFSLHPTAEWSAFLRQYGLYRFARLTAFLRQREADDTLNYSILVYHLTDEDIRRALEGPPPELGPDRAKEMLELNRGGRE